MWPFNTGDCLIEVTTWAGLTVLKVRTVKQSDLLYWKRTNQEGLVKLVFNNNLHHKIHVIITHLVKLVYYNNLNNEMVVVIKHTCNKLVTYFQFNNLWDSWNFYGNFNIFRGDFLVSYTGSFFSFSFFSSLFSLHVLNFISQSVHF